MAVTFAELLKRFIIYEDPDESIAAGDNRFWIFDSLGPSSDNEMKWTRSPIAVQLYRAIEEACKGPQPPSHPPPSSVLRLNTTRSRIPQPPSFPPLNTASCPGPRTTEPPMMYPQPARPAPAMEPLRNGFCSHPNSMPNGMQWECKQSIGRDIFDGNLLTPGASDCQSWSQRLFGNSGLIPPRGFEQAILQSNTWAPNTWAHMFTHGTRYMGIASRCSHCDKICRISFSASSTKYHMDEQRAVLLCWLGLPYNLPAPQPNMVPPV